MIAPKAMERVRNAAARTRGAGMAATIRGADINALLSDYDALNGNGSAGILELRQAVKLADEILRDRPELWGQPLSAALEQFHEGTVAPVGVVDAVKDAVGRYRRTKR